MTSYEELSRQIDEADEAMRRASANLGNFEALRGVLAELVGRGEAAEGLVVAEWTATGLAELTFNPRVMRMPSEDLAEAVKTAVREAAEDLRTQTRAALDEAGIGGRTRPSIEEVRARLDEVRESTISNARRSASDLGRAQEYRRQSGF